MFSKSSVKLPLLAAEPGVTVRGSAAAPAPALGVLAGVTERRSPGVTLPARGAGEAE